MLKIFHLLSVFFLLFSSIFSQNSKILLDEDFNDWQEIKFSQSDPANDAGINPDILNLKMTNNKNYLFIMFKLSGELILQENNNMTLYLDCDNNNLTGQNYNGMGADFVFTFGKREGKIIKGGTSIRVLHFNVGLVSSPTYSSDIFEIALDINLLKSFSSTYLNDSVRVSINTNAKSGDNIPDLVPGEAYALNNFTDEYTLQGLRKTDSEYLRVMTWNVERDAIFETQKQPAFKRLLKAIKPDVIGFQEIYNHSSSLTAALVSQLFPEDAWFHSSAGMDVQIVSKYPVIASSSIDGNGAFLIDATEKYGRKLLVISAHPPCCDNNVDRQKEMDNFMAFVRDCKNSTGEIALESETPIIILGDMNMVGYSDQLRTILNGDIYYNQLYGDDFNPDWDNSPLEDSKPYTLGTPFTFTWYAESGTYSSGRLDYLVYSGSSLTLKNSFVLFTKSLPEDSLSTYGLLRNDISNASDHLPLAADFQISNPTGINSFDNRTSRNNSLQIYPNPANPSSTIEFNVESQTYVSLIVYDMLGKKVITLKDEYMNPGNYSITFDGSLLSSGIYFSVLRTSGELLIRKIAVLK